MDKKTVKLQIWDTAGQVSTLLLSVGVYFYYILHRHAHKYYVHTNNINVIKKSMIMNDNLHNPITNKRNDSEQLHQHITEEQMELLWFMIQHHQIHLIM